MSGKSNGKSALQAARELAMARAETREAAAPPPQTPDLSIEECFLRLALECYASELRVGMGVMPDGMAIWVRLSYPTSSKDARAGMVSFLVSDEPLSVLLKAVVSLEAEGKPPYWKADRFAANGS